MLQWLKFSIQLSLGILEKKLKNNHKNVLEDLEIILWKKSHLREKNILLIHSGKLIHSNQKILYPFLRL